MSLRASCVLFVSSLVILASADDMSKPIATPDLIFEEKDGLAAIEAEHFFEQTLADKRAWYLTTKDREPEVEPDGDPSHVAGASGGAYLEILPDTRRTHDDELVFGENIALKPGQVGVLSYKVHFNTPGKYWIWARTYNTGSEDNGLHFGINRSWPKTAERWQTIIRKRWHWSSTQRTKEVHVGVPGILTFDVPSVGVHTIHVCMREDGIELDKILFVNRKDYKPEGLGPAPATRAGVIPKSFPFVPEAKKGKGR